MVGSFLHVLLVVLSFCVQLYSANSECSCSVSGTVMDCSYRNCRNKPKCTGDITVLEMSGNGITELTEGHFENCIINIKEVYLDNNNISKIDVAAFQGLDNLAYIDLSINNITTLKLDLEYNKLTNLNLAGNPLQSLTFIGKKTFKHLNLTSCQLRSGDDVVRSLEAFHKLTTLDLSSNNLTNWSEITKYVVKLKEMEFLYVSDNLWECECPRDENMMEKMMGLVVGGDPKCASPQVVAGNSLWNVSCPLPTTTTTTITASTTISSTTIPSTIESETTSRDYNTSTTDTVPAQHEQHLQASNLNEATVYGATAFFFVVVVAAVAVELHARSVRKRASDNSLWWQDEDRVNGSAKYKYENIFPDD